MPSTASPQLARGPVRPGPDAHVALRPAVADVYSGFWHTRRQVNARTSIPLGPGLLESAGNLSNLRLAAGAEDGEFQGAYPFVDTDVHKWLEAAAWQLGQWAPGDGGHEARRLADDVARIAALVAGAQRPDGYLNTWLQLQGLEPYPHPPWAHELHSPRHLIPAAA